MRQTERAQITAVLQTAVGEACALLREGEVEGRFDHSLGDILEHVMALVALVDLAPVADLLTGEGAQKMAAQMTQQLDDLEHLVNEIRSDRAKSDSTTD